MKTRILAALLVTGFASAGALADHNSLFGDNTGRTVGGVHDDRFASNVKRWDNRDTMGAARFQVQAQGGLGGYRQGGMPATVVPGAGTGTHGAARR